MMAIGALLILGAVLWLLGCSPLMRRPPAPARSSEPLPADVLEGIEKIELPPEALDGPILRVGLAEGLVEATVSARGAFEVALYGDSTVIWKGEDGDEWTFRDVESRLAIGGPDGALAGGSGTVRVRASGAWPVVYDGTPYRGELEIFAPLTGGLTVVNVVDVESYLRGVVPLEIGPRPVEEIEAVKAQAVAARTYAVSASGSRAQGDFDVFATVSDQVYGGYDAENDVCDRAVLETVGLVLLKSGEPITAYFHSTCGGRTEARQEIWELAELPYLESIWDTPGGITRPDEAYCSSASSFTWTEKWSGGEIEELVRAQLPSVASTPVEQPFRKVKDLQVTARTPSGRVRWLEVETDGGTYRVFGDKVRWLLRRPGSTKILKSAWFELEVRRRGGRVTEVVADGRGLGHGVGMCQHGAMEMARRGFTYDEILRHYYRDVAIRQWSRERGPYGSGR